MVYEERLIRLEGVRILGGRFRNFSGNPTEYHKDGGVREFAVVVPESEVNKMMNDGIIVKRTKVYDDDGNVEEGVDGLPFIKVKVRFDSYRPPMIYMVSPGKTPQHLPEDMVDLLDASDIVDADMVIKHAEMKINGELRHPLYLRSLWANIEPDYFQEKYARRDEERERGREERDH
jgi:hypothetical protein